MVQFQRLEGFYWVARTGGYARAARAFPYPISQPGVHQQVRRLEADLGVALFERTGKDRMVLTAAGRALYEFSTPFLEGLPGVVQAIRRGKQGGRLRIHAAGLVLRQLLPPWVKRLQARRPDIEVELSEARIADSAPLRSGEADLLVDHLPEIPPDLGTRRVGTVRAFVAVPATHSLARKTRLQLGHLRGDAFIGYSPGRRHRELQMKALALHGLSPRPSLSADTSEGILSLVAAGLGFSIVPSMLPGGPHVRGVAAHRLTRPSAEFAVVAAWRRTAVANPLVEAALAAAPT